jgi:hypothetical protein
MHLSSGGDQRLRTRITAGHAEYLVARSNEFPYDGRAYEPVAPVMKTCMTNSILSPEINRRDTPDICEMSETSSGYML